MFTMSAAPSPVNSSSDAAEIPVLDFAPYLSEQSAAREKLARQLCHALENIGFYFIKGHGVPQSLIDAAFAATARFHAQPLDRKMKLPRNRDNVGYLPMSRSDDPEAVIKPNVSEAFFLKRDLPAVWSSVSVSAAPTCGPMICPGFGRPSLLIVMRWRAWRKSWCRSTPLLSAYPPIISAGRSPSRNIRSG